MKSFNQNKENVLLIFKVEKINIACHPINYSCSYFLIKPSRMSAIHIVSFRSIDLKGKILPRSLKRPYNKVISTDENQNILSFIELLKIISLKSTKNFPRWLFFNSSRIFQTWPLLTENNGSLLPCIYK